MKKVYLIRHANSEQEALRSFLRIFMGDREAANKLANQLRSDILFDPPLTELATKYEIPTFLKSHSQTLNKVRMVVSSPSLSSLQTTQLLFGKAARDKKVQVVVHPRARRRIVHSFHYPLHWERFRDEHPEFMWKLMEAFTWDDLLWMAPSLADKKIDADVHQVLNENKLLPIKEQLQKVFGMTFNGLNLRENFGHYLHSVRQLDMWLANQLAQQGLKDHEVVIVANSSILELLHDKDKLNFRVKSPATRSNMEPLTMLEAEVELGPAPPRHRPK